MLELKYSKADDSRSNDAEQLNRYREAVNKMPTHHLHADPDDIQVGMFAPNYDNDHFDSTLDQSTIDRIDFRQFGRSPETPKFTT